MPTTVVVTVKPSGGDYTSLASAEAGEQRDLVSADEIAAIECYAMNDTAGVVIDGWTTDATRYVRVYCPESERHPGYFSTAHFRVTMGTQFDQGITVFEDYTRLEWLQILCEVTNNVCIDPRAANLYVNGFVIHAHGMTTDYGVLRDSGGTSTGTHTIRNSVIVSGGVGIIRGANADKWVVENCTFIGGAIDDSAAVRNTYCPAGIVTATSQTNNTAAAYSTANFVNVTSGSEDLHLVSGSALIGAGTDLSGSFTDDIDGETRASWDIGADEFSTGIATEQYGFRWRNDDGDEDAATWKAAQNTDVSIAPDTPLRLRVGIDTTGDVAGAQYKLQYRKVGDSTWNDVNPE